MMMSKLSGFLPVIVLVITAVFVSGCATSNVNYTNEASVLFERMRSEDVLISDVHAYEDGDELVIYGKVKRAADNCCDSARGHVDIAIVAPDGMVTEVINVSYSPRNIPKVRSRTSRFMTRLPYTLPEDITLRITYHNSLEVAASTAHASGKFLCEQNMAVHNQG